MHGRKDWHVVSHSQANERQNHPIARQINRTIRIVVIEQRQLHAQQPSCLRLQLLCYFP